MFSKNIKTKRAPFPFFSTGWARSFLLPPQMEQNLARIRSTPQPIARLKPSNVSVTAVQLKQLFSLV